jgi:hypothetical protein
MPDKDHIYMSTALRLLIAYPRPNRNPGRKRSDMLMKVLSVDWDFFINSRGYELYYLQGYNDNTPSAVLNEAWAEKYMLSQGGLFSANVEGDLCERIASVIEAHRGDYIACENHGRIFGFLESGIGYSEEPVEIHNFDYHHDAYVWGIGNAVNCANWVRRIIEKLPNSEYNWYYRSRSDMMHLGGDIRNENFIRCHPVYEIDWDEFLKLRFDIVFVCRSDIYSPPHLDADFIRYMIPNIRAADRMSSMTIEDCLLKPRPIPIESTVRFKGYMDNTIIEHIG